jgi:hypothetical protein
MRFILDGNEGNCCLFVQVDANEKKNFADLVKKDNAATLNVDKVDLIAAQISQFQALQKRGPYQLSNLDSVIANYLSELPETIYSDEMLEKYATWATLNSLLSVTSLLGESMKKTMAPK